MTIYVCGVCEQIHDSAEPGCNITVVSGSTISMPITPVQLVRDAMNEAWRWAGRSPDGAWEAVEADPTPKAIQDYFARVEVMPIADRIAYERWCEAGFTAWYMACWLKKHLNVTDEELNTSGWSPDEPL